VDYINAAANLNADTGALQSQRNEVKEQQLKLDLQYSFSSDLSMNGGYQYSETEIVNRGTEFNSIVERSQRNVLYSNAFFLNSKLKLFEKKTVISAGARFTNYPNLSQQFLEPRLNVFQKINSNLSAAVTGELKHQAIVQSIRVKNNILGLENESWIILNDANGAILESKQLSLSSTFKKDGWNLSVEGFLKKVANINSANQGFRNQLIDVTTAGSYDVNGLEFSISKKTEHLNAWFSYGLMNSNYTFDMLNPSTFRSNFDVRHTASVAASYSWDALLFSLGSKFHSGIPFTRPVPGNEIVVTDGIAEINFTEVNSASLKEFFRTDFSASYTRQLDQTFSAKLSLALLNIFDRKNALDTYYVLEYDEAGNAIPNRVEQFSLGFTPNIALQLLF
jgi:hypothetical protein